MEEKESEELELKVMTMEEINEFLAQEDAKDPRDPMDFICGTPLLDD